MSDRGTCHWCDRPVALRLDGTVRLHWRRRGDGCPGGLKMPVPTRGSK